MGIWDCLRHARLLRKVAGGKVAGDGGGLWVERLGGGSHRPRAVEDNRLACGGDGGVRSW